MDTGIIYSRYVTGKNNLGRKGESAILGNLLRQGENVVIYEPPKTGKTSLVQQTFFTMRAGGEQFTSVSFEMSGIRSTGDFALGFGTAVLRAFGDSAEDFGNLTARFLAQTHFVFDFAEFSSKGHVLSLTWDIDDNDLRALMLLPHRIAAESGRRLVILIEEFQDIMMLDDGEKICRIMEETIKSLTPEERGHASFIFCGSMVNAMKSIFKEKHFLYRNVERVKLDPIGEKDIADFMIKYFLSLGKVVERELMLGVCRLFKCNIWYISHFCNICDGIAKGYIMEPMLKEALDNLISIHEPRFKAMMSDLTNFQVSLLRAVTEGYTKCSSSEVISKFNLNSSANVRRLKDALCKKEILTFDEDDKPEILDPLFEYWVTTVYFGQTI